MLIEELWSICCASTQHRKTTPMILALSLCSDLLCLNVPEQEQCKHVNKWKYSCRVLLWSLLAACLCWYMCLNPASKKSKICFSNLYRLVSICACTEAVQQHKSKKILRLCFWSLAATACLYWDAKYIPEEVVQANKSKNTHTAFL